MRIRIDLADGRFFKSKTDAARHFSALLRSKKIDDVIEIDTPDGADLLALLRRHPEAESRIGCGVARFFVGLACGDYGGFGTSCFWLERTDGTRTDWSYRTALDGRHRRTKERIALACRSAVRDQTSEAFWAAQTDGGWLCAMSGDTLPAGRAVVDHAQPWPFWRIVEAFVEREGGMDELAKALRPTEDGVGGEFFAAQEVADRFAAWHREVAVLQVIDVAYNAALGGRRG